jgi:hypothetical protein
MRRLFAVLLLLAPCPLFAWGNQGHRVTAAFAEEQLPSGTLQKALQILGTAHLADVATDPDKWKSNPGEFRNAEWHFVDTPLGKTYLAARDCPFSDCVIDRVTQFANILKTETNAPRRKEALVYLIHFVGDIHQPLHCETGFLPGGESDRGGNGITGITLNGQHLNGKDDKNDNLHFLWDVSLIENAALSDEAYVKHLDELLKTVDADVAKKGKPADWAREAHAIAEKVQLKSGTDVHSAYVNRNTPRVDLQLLRGGLRLARLIEEALSGQ